MSIEMLLRGKKTEIIRRWFDCIVETYPPDTGGFLRDERDRFANPAGYIISRGLETVFDELTHPTDSGSVIAALDSILRIRAVQNFNTLQALTFIFLIKRAVKEEIGEEIETERLFREYLSFESRVDAMALFACDVYVKIREEIYRGRVREIAAEREKALGILRMMGHEGDT